MNIYTMAALENYIAQRKAGKKSEESTYVAKKCGIEQDVEFWK